MKNFISINGVRQEITDDVINAIIELSKPKNIIDRVKTFEDACNVLGISSELPDFKGLLGGFGFDEKSYIAKYKLEIIIRALNQGWYPDWNNNNEYKYYPCFDMRDSFSFDFVIYDYYAAKSVVGSLLCYKTKELAEYGGKQFESLYKDLLTK